MLINSIPLLEAQATDRMFRFTGENGNPPDAATKEALRYRAAP